MLTLYPMFDTFSEAEAFSKTLFSLGQALWQLHNLSLEEKQHSQIIKYQILGNYATVLFTRYEVAKKPGMNNPVEIPQDS